MPILNLESFFSNQSSKTNILENKSSQDNINSGILQETEEENYFEIFEQIEFDIEKIEAERRATEEFNSSLVYKKLSDMLVSYAEYLSKSINDEDVKLSFMIYNGLIQLPTKNYEPLDNVFKILEKRALNDKRIVNLVPQWKMCYDDCKKVLEVSVSAKKNNLDRKRTEYNKVSFFGKLKKITIMLINLIDDNEEIQKEGKRI